MLVPYSGGRTASPDSRRASDETHICGACARLETPPSRLIGRALAGQRVGGPRATQPTMGSDLDSNGTVAMDVCRELPSRRRAPESTIDRLYRRRP